MRVLIAVVTSVVSSWMALPEAHAARTTRYFQAEAPENQGNCGPNHAETQHAGYTGTAYANCNGNSSSYLEWTGVALPTAATRRLAFRYANGSTQGRPAELRVDGAVVSPSLTFPSTGGWTTWATIGVDVPLGAGDHVIRLRGTDSAGLPNLDRMDVSDPVGPVDWGVAVVESTLLRHPTAVKLGGWTYTNGLLLHGIYLVYLRTGDERYLRFIKSWFDALIDAEGNLYTSAGRDSVRSLGALDYLLPGRALLDVYGHFPQPGFRVALRTLRNRFSSASNDSGGRPTWSSAYPRTSDGGYWHSTGKRGELWLDGLYMGQMFLSAYGEAFGGADERYADDEGTKQILVQARHLRDPATGLFWHAYDEQRDPSWPLAPGTNHSRELWCRAMGWYGMGMIEVLEVLASDHPARAQVIALVRGLVAAWSRYQDPASGRWFQLVDKGSNPKNWTETSCSSMYAYVISRAVEAGYVPASYQTVADKGYAGVLQRITLVAEAALAADLTSISGISEGTNVGDADYYFGRGRPVNDKHGLGAFLIMYEQFQM